MLICTKNSKIVGAPISVSIDRVNKNFPAVNIWITSSSFYPKYCRRQRARTDWNKDCGSVIGQTRTPGQKWDSTPSPDEAITPHWGQNHTPALERGETLRSKHNLSRKFQNFFCRRFHHWRLLVSLLNLRENTHMLSNVSICFTSSLEVYFMSWSFLVLFVLLGCLVLYFVSEIIWNFARRTKLTLLTSFNAHQSLSLDTLTLSYIVLETLVFDKNWEKSQIP